MATPILIGLDLGTKTIVAARRGDDGRPIFKSEINCFLEFPVGDSFTRNMLAKQQIPHVPLGNKLFALGRKAEELAYAMNLPLKRPMADGTVSREEEAITIMATIVHAIIGKLDKDGIVYYCIPADAINKATNVQIHQKIAQSIIDGYKKTNATVKGYPVNEARAIAIGSGEPVVIAISFGAGMVNVCYTMYGITIFEFSIVGSGDFIDVEVAKQFGFDPQFPDRKAPESPTTVCRKKEKIDLTKASSDDRIEQRIIWAYQILIENVVDNILKGFTQNIDRGRFDKPLPIIMAGGTASPPGFADYFEKILRSKTLPFEISSITVHSRPLFAVAEGCLVAAENHQE